MDTLVIFFAKYVPYVVAGLFFIFVWKFRRHPLTISPLEKGERVKLLVEGAVAAFLSRGFVEVIRLFVHRPRPFVLDPSLVPLLSETSFSFPSGHAAFFFALATTVYVHDKRLGVWFVIAAALIGAARVAAHVHYLMDIIGGAVLGVLVGFAVHKAYEYTNHTNDTNRYE